MLQILLCASALLAENSLSPEDALQRALERNADLAASAARVGVSEGLRVQAGLKPNPRLVLQVENTRFTPFNYGQETDNFGYLTQVFEAGGKRQARVDLASAAIESSRLNLGVQRTQLAARVLGAYWNAVGAQQLTTVLAESLQVLERTVQYHRDRVQQGSLPEADLLRVQLEYQQVLMNLRNAQQDARRSRQLLFREMGVAEEPDVKLTGDLGAVPPAPLVDLEEAVNRRPDVKTAAQSVLQAQAAVRLQKANAKPDPEVAFGYKRTAGYNTLIGGVQINLPVRNRNQGAIAAAASEETASTSTLRALRTAARTEIQTLLGEYEQKRHLVEQVLPPMRAQAGETRRIADAVYREGASDLLRLLDAERVRIQAETMYIRSVLEYRLAAVNLQNALGLLP